MYLLDEKYEDVLVNVNIMDSERTKKNLDNIKSHAGYQAYDQEEVDELTGNFTLHAPPGGGGGEGSGKNQIKKNNFMDLTYQSESIYIYWSV